MSQPLSLEQRIGQLLFIGLPGASIDDTARQLLEIVQPGGVILFARNIESATQVAQMNAEIRSLIKVPPFISIDQEGGRVDRLRAIFPPMPSAQAIRASGDASLAGRHGEITAEVLRLLGFNMNFAPVLDLAYDEAAVNARDRRCFGSTPAEVIRIAGAYLEGLQNNGIIGCGKHFPGMGAAIADPHKDLPVVTRSRERLIREDLLPYRDLFTRMSTRLHVVMVSHCVYTALDRDGAPASLSPNVVTRLLREELGFHGTAITDDLEMGAIATTHGFDQVILKAVEAGEDMLLICRRPELIIAAFETLVRAVRDGRISHKRIERSIDHIVDAKSIISSPAPFNQSALNRLAERVAEISYQLQPFAE